ncbi:cell division protein [Aliidongia dinghuensis]|uniref:Cell division protein n=1 Tax=Aliidongia dinghuensis TaxID=1867774 RepID=A0A8J2Z1C6_9PROT|nr:cell division protein [Aliidongia dinghuensis]GGF46725.1 cell division protein [Aliidongia dinghuensis]
MARAPALPLSTDGSTRFLPWLVALMVYLAALTIAAGAALHSAVDSWNAGLAGTLTIELPRGADGTPVPPARLEATLKQLAQDPGIARAVPLDAAAETRLLAPWLGQDVDVSVLPLPVLIDVQTKPGALIDPDTLAQRLAITAPGTRVESHGSWLARLFRIAGLIEFGAALIVVLIGAVAVLTVIFTTRTGLAIHAPVVELVHLIGASDTYVARQFQWHAFRLGLGGGGIGLVMALVSYGALRWTADQGLLPGEAALLPTFRLPLLGWVAVLALPPLMGLVALVTARRTVLRTLGRMP